MNKQHKSSKQSGLHPKSSIPGSKGTNYEVAMQRKTQGASPGPKAGVGNKKT